MSSATSILDRRYRRRSALEAFQCPKYFHETYVQNRRHESHPTQRGTAWHLALRRYVELLHAHPSQPEDDLDLAQQAFREAMAASRVSHAVIAEVAELWDRFVPTFHLDHDTLLMHEEQPDDEYQWQPDLVRAYRPSTLEITDFKTHFAVLSEDAARAAFQGKFYAARARRVWPGFQVYRFSFWFVRWGVIVHVELEQSDIDRHEEHLAILEAGIATALQLDEWPAVPGETCQYCDLKCPVADDALLHPVRLQTKADAERVLGEYLALKRAAAARRLTLEQYTSFEGPVRLNGMEFGPRPVERTTFPIQDVMDVFTRHGLTPTFSVAKTAIKPYLTQKRYQHIAPELEALGQEKRSTEFLVRKVGDLALAQPEREDDFS